jgi:hypothetical protein
MLTETISSRDITLGKLIYPVKRKWVQYKQKWLSHVGRIENVRYNTEAETGHLSD